MVLGQYMIIRYLDPLEEQCLGPKSRGLGSRGLIPKSLKLKIAQKAILLHIFGV